MKIIIANCIAFFLELYGALWLMIVVSGPNMIGPDMNWQQGLTLFLCICLLAVHYTVIAKYLIVAIHLDNIHSDNKKFPWEKSKS